MYLDFGGSLSIRDQPFLFATTFADTNADVNLSFDDATDANKSELERFVICIASLKSLVFDLIHRFVQESI